ncbi:RNA polymerase ECF-type sigma factor [Polaribacter irgensii 23-P]|uniref:RNA polymerase ECF-type sigma factor n=1 Tax=Polaribacter irgensii 23-P TaxID=313594 RepID=A4BZN7_9FLAO|nr:sigma-70 family RNA polymerase sigma factor [Polaribacter irgensii]EAR12630.1 RNA polymerase ECF-type sigma factor [Polaribacter irgensii 23-P]
MQKRKKDKYFEEILEGNKHKIYRICNIYAIPPIEPQDLFQEVVYQIWKSLDSFKSNSSIDTWVYKISLNVCLRSKMKLDKNYSKTYRFESIYFTPIEKEIDTSVQEKLKYLKECISTLNGTDTSLIVLYLDDLSYKEIEVITGLTENHIAVKMKRIRKKLFECITPKIN